MKQIKKSENIFDVKKLAEQVRLAIGERTLSSFAEQTGVSKSYVSKILNQKLPVSSPPSRKILIKMADSEIAAPRNGITLSDLFASCGYNTSELEEKQDKEESLWMPEISSVIKEYYSNVLPMTAVSILLNGLALNGMGNSMIVETKNNYFRISIAESEETYVGIPAFGHKKEAFVFMHATVLGILLVLSDRRENTTFYVLVDNEQFYQYLISHLKASADMKLAVLYTQDYMFIASEQKIGENQMEWNPVTVKTAPKTL